MPKDMLGKKHSASSLHREELHTVLPRQKYEVAGDATHRKILQLYKKAMRTVRQPFLLCECFHFVQVLAKTQAFCMIIHNHLQSLCVLSKTAT